MTGFFEIFEYSGSIVSFSVPESGFYQIESWGSSGGGVNKARGAYSVSFLNLSLNDNLLILVGQAADKGSSSYPGCGGGGGGTFVAKGCSASNSIPLCIAGGGGSQNLNEMVSNYAHGQSTESGGDYLGRTPNLGHGGQSGYGSGGGGFFSDGIIGTYSNWGQPGKSFVSGGTSVEGIYSSSAYGGFGGGASSSGHCGGPAGGGGYTGGSVSSDQYHNGGGGGSFHIGSYQGNNSYSLAGYEFMPNPYNSDFIQGNSGNGYVKLTFLSSFSPISRSLSTCLQDNLILFHFPIRIILLLISFMITS